jgi:trans-aconitate methyltransferase
MSTNPMTELYRGLERLGPGEAADIEWLGMQIELKDQALIADLACGGGADIGPLLGLTAKGSVIAIDQNPDFLERARELWGAQARVDIRLSDMREPGGRFDLIWCAGAIYFLGITTALNAWKTSLSNGGHVAFSEPCFWSEQPSKEASGIWAQYSDMGDEASIRDRIDAAGYDTIATRQLSDTAWSGYYAPLLERIGELRTDAGPELRLVLEETLAEIVAWNKSGDQYGYLLCVVSPR